MTQECSRRKYDTSRFDERSKAIEEFGSEIKDECHPAWKKRAFHRLRTIRNALAHGNPPRDPRDRTILGDADRLKAELGLRVPASPERRQQGHDRQFSRPG